MAWCIVNTATDDNRESKVSSTSTIFSKWKKQSFNSREFKRGATQLSVWGNTGRPTPFIMPNLSDPQFTNPANVNNLIQTSNDHVDVASDYTGSANGYVFPKPARITQGFKTFGIKVGKIGHIYGTGAFYSHNEYPYEIR
jgi:hypothetical protein